MLVHVTLGALPVLVLAYVVAAVRRSERWTFAADAVLVTTAVVTLATFAFGLVSNATVSWPGGLGTWRWLHLALGITTTSALAVLAAFRLFRRRRQAVPLTGVPTALAALGVAAVAAATGWVGGEVLVFHSGMAVRGAAGGALAPALGEGHGSPKDVHEAMGFIRADWATVRTASAAMLVERPAAAEFDRVADGAARLEALARWLSVDGARDLARAGSEPANHHAIDAGASRERSHHLTEMARDLERSAGRVRADARARDLAALVESIGSMEMQCAHCHAELRWRQAP
jgi:hypothetical protein